MVEVLAQRLGADAEREGDLRLRRPDCGGAAHQPAISLEHVRFVTLQSDGRALVFMTERPDRIEMSERWDGKASSLAPAI